MSDKHQKRKLAPGYKSTIEALLTDPKLIDPIKQGDIHAQKFHTPSIP